LKRAAIFLLLVALSGCVNEEAAPPPNEGLTGPELSHEREPRKGGDPPPPIREDLRRTKIALITQADSAPVVTTVTAGPPPAPTEAGTVNPLR
jgi:hypothetical protein